MIELKGVNKIYNSRGASRTHAVCDVSMQLPDRGMVAIFGRSGCGKTTLLNCIGGLDRVTSGSVSFDGTAVTPDATALRNRHIGYIFQNYNLSKGMSVFENVALSLRLCGVRDEAEIERRVMAALESVDMAKYCKRMPDALSGGQQQRVAIARAIVKNPTLILADEPTGNLDEHNTVLVMDLLKEISREHLVLLVTHEASLVDLYCDRVLEMDDGRVIAQRENATTGGYHGKGADEIYLGELPMQVQQLGEGCVEYYGDPADMPTQLRLVSVGGTLYIQAQTPLKLRLVDHGSEALLHEGKYEERKKREVREISPTLREPLPESGDAGRLYSLGYAIKSGFCANFTKTRRGKKLLIAALVCFPVVIALVMSIFGTVFYELQHVRESYNGNTVFVSSEAISSEQLAAYRERGLLDHISVTRYGGGEGYPRLLEYYYFSIGNFETFVSDYSSFFSAQGLLLTARTLAADAKMVCGVAKVANEKQIVISRGYADLLLQQVGVDFIKTYEDLLYTVGRYNAWQRGTPTQSVVGITDETEAVIYLDDYTYAQLCLDQLYACEPGTIVDIPHSDVVGSELSRGEVYCYLLEDGKPNHIHANVKVGDRLTIGEMSLTVKGFLTSSFDKEAFDLWVIRQYGSDVFESLSAYSKWFYGVDCTDYAQWVESGINEGWTHADMLLDLQKSYDADYKFAREDFSNSVGGSVPTLVMHPDDLQALSMSVPTGVENNTFYRMYTDWVKYSTPYYALHTEDPDLLASTLLTELSQSDVTTPDEMQDFESSYLIEELLVAAVAILAVALVMSLCLYFIMRSSLMGDIKEVGTLRAIGVSRRNLVFRYLVETLVLFSLTVFVGYLLSSAALLGIGTMHQSMAQLLYYPWWMALLLLIGLIAVSILCGLLPILSLLRRTPAQILSKYDI